MGGRQAAGSSARLQTSILTLTTTIQLLQRSRFDWSNAWFTFCARCGCPEDQRDDGWLQCIPDWRHNLASINVTITQKYHTAFQIVPKPKTILHSRYYMQTGIILCASNISCRPWRLPILPLASSHRSQWRNKEMEDNKSCRDNKTAH